MRFFWVAGPPVLDIKTLAETLEEVEPDFQASLVEGMDNERVADVLEEMEPDEAADKLYNEGLYLLNVRHDARGAVKKFEEVDRQHPYSDWARKALIMSTSPSWPGPTGCTSD